MPGRDGAGPGRIMHVVLSLEPGGMENGIVNMANQLDPAEFALDVCCLARVGAFAARLPGHVRVHCLDKPEGVSPGTALALRRLVHRERIELLHSHNLGPLIYSAAAIFGTDCRLLHGEHGQLAGRDLEAGRLRLRRWLYRRCRRVHTVSESLRQDLVQHGFAADHIEAVTNGVDTARFMPSRDKAAARIALGLPAAVPVLGIVGRLIPSKRHRLLLEAAAICRAGGIDLRLLIIGGGPDEAIIRSGISELNLADMVIMAGHQDDPIPWYHAMDLHVMPTEREGLSNVMLEAMACGVPSLANSACGSSELIDHGRNGWLVPQRTGAELAGAIAAVLGTPGALVAAGDAARKTAVERFSLASMAEGYRNLYRRLLNG